MKFLKAIKLEQFAVILLISTLLAVAAGVLIGGPKAFFAVLIGWFIGYVARSFEYFDNQR